ncbi:hypothetical protein SISNIDRAFT_452590 [Sistotremastrum niveocremeum HHB9708]|uniref:Uncharacterized protein n=1 Tax=Sistotremastrum niveocremeum HHB9708 TaxID=1314777 RepID=A0A164WPH9_9AGAM|nr:hypothetical protein SISNIDRAFT_452590 [Sistotremastrum niveocremeum HHB9708]
MASSQPQSDTTNLQVPQSIAEGSSGSGSSPATTPAKKSRRQTAFYPFVNSTNKPSKPFSRSAAKRESVMALGSIEHLQHYFTKTGLAAKHQPLKPSSNARPALGSFDSHKQTTDDHSILEEPDFIFPETPAPPSIHAPSFPPFVKTYEVDPDQLRPAMIDDLDVVARTWRLPPSPPSVPSSSSAPSDFLSPVRNHRSPTKDYFDILTALKVTTRAIRSVRNYLISLPDDESGPVHRAPQREFQPHTLKPKIPTRSVSNPDHNPSSSSTPLARIRRSALDLLAVLRSLEESARLPLSDDAYDAQSDHGSESTRSQNSAERVSSPMSMSDEDIESNVSFAFSVVKVSGRHAPVPVWTEEQDEFAQEEEEEKKDDWDERLVLGSGWLYRNDMTLEELEVEKEAVGKYLDTVDEVLFSGPREDGSRGWEAVKRELVKEKVRRGSGGDGEGTSTPPRGRSASARLEFTEEPSSLQEVLEEEEEIEDVDLPIWAKRSSFSDEPLERARALLVHLLPASIIHALPPPSNSSRLDLLQSLASGQLLCFAYNAGVRKSRKQWGFINLDSVHDILALESGPTKEDVDEKGKKIGWTFRRIDNLRLWIAALKLRYLIQIITPAQALQPLAPPPSISHKLVRSPSPSPSPLSKPVALPPHPPQIELPVFDAKLVARGDEGWDEMLETAVMTWVEAVVAEKRGQR